MRPSLETTDPDAVVGEFDGAGASVVDRIELSNEAILALLAMPRDDGAGDDLAFLPPPSGPPTPLVVLDGYSSGSNTSSLRDVAVSDWPDDGPDQADTSAAVRGEREASSRGPRARYVSCAVVLSFVCVAGVLSIDKIPDRSGERTMTTRPESASTERPPGGESNTVEPTTARSVDPSVDDRLTATTVPAAPTVTVDGDRLPPLDPKPDTDGLAAGTDPTLGATFPTITGQALGGGQITLSPGSPMLVAVVAHWSDESQSLVRQISELAKLGAIPPGVVVAALSSAERPGGSNYPPAVWFAENGFPFGVLLDDARRSAVVALSVDRFPTMLSVRPDGSIAMVHRGVASHEDILGLLGVAAG